MRKVAKSLGYLTAASVLGVVAVVGWLSWTSVTSGDLPALKNGDIIFQTIQSSQTAAIGVATRSPFTHVGIIKLINGKPFVVEAVGPVREVSLDAWIKQGIGGRIAIKRLSNLTADQARRVLSAARKYYGRPYDFFFLFDKESIYCSELVYYAFRDGMKLTLGKVEKLKELSMDNSIVRSLVKERWKRYPPCSRIGDYEKCFRVVLEQELVSPASIAEDPKLETVYSNYKL
ncbi:MAG: peptidoglycan peptidase [Alphaproteobacteria bacterium]|nr:peptidoglycan peptidase [Alphaproteobacteria bacterium]